MNSKTLTFLSLILTLCFNVTCLAQNIEIGNTKFSKSLIDISDGQPSVIACDFNADGFQDIVIASYSDNSLVTYRGNGKGELIRVGEFAAGDRPTGLAVSDVDGDGHLDMVVANHETDYVTLLYGNGKGQFNLLENSKLKVNINPHPHHVQLNDLDGDNRLDLIVDSREHRGLLVLYGLGEGRFKTPGSIINVDGDPYRGFAIKDINRDGRLDVVTPNQNEVAIVLSGGENDSAYTLRKLPQPESPFSVELADMNGDGAKDLIVATSNRLVSIYRGDGKGQFLEDNKTQIQTPPGAKQIVIGDINGDGVQDALVSNWSGELLALVGGTHSIDEKRFSFADIPNPWGIALTDLNKDGKDDLIVADGAGKSAALLISQSKHSGESK